MMQSDMHCNTTMVALQRHVATMLSERYGPDVPALLAITGDLTTNGTAAEGHIRLLRVCRCGDRDDGDGDEPTHQNAPYEKQRSVSNLS